MKRTKTLTQPIKWHGGKRYLAKEIVALMPPHLHYVEPFAGGLAVLLERDPNDKRLWVADDGQRGGVSEVVGDLNRELTNFWVVLRHPDFFPQFQRLCEATEFGRRVFETSEIIRRPTTAGNADDQVWSAWAFFVRARQSRAGTFKGFTSLTRNRTRRGVNGNVSEWLGAVDGLAAVHARLRPVVVENMDALTLIAREDTPDTLFYLDPPYMHGTRATPDAYAHEMSDEGHHNLLTLIRRVQGKVILSGYRSPMYDDLLGKWRRVDFDLPNNAAGGDTKRRMVESVWMNYPEARP